MLVFNSFGFKYGLPQDANYIFDVRFIPNPFYVAELKPLSGMDEPVQKYIKVFDETGAFLTSAAAFLDFVIPEYFRAGREILHVAIGCTGGRHRSVALVEWLGERYRKKLASVGADVSMEIRHRDIDIAQEA